MMSFRSRRLQSLSIPAETASHLVEIALVQGRRQPFASRNEKALEPLAETARLESVQASCRLDGMDASAERLRSLLPGKTRPRSPEESELLGYRHALDWVYGNGPGDAISPSTLQRLHSLAQPHCRDAGHWKEEDNRIEGFGSRFDHFRPVSALHTPSAVQQLCKSYRQFLAESRIPSLLVQALLVLDFLCISPFSTANGRVSRLLSHLALCRNGLQVGRYVSLEGLLAEASQDYRQTLQSSLTGWHLGDHDFRPWMSFYVQLVRQACRLFEERAGRVRIRGGAKQALVESVVRRLKEGFTRSQLEALCPSVSPETVRLVLRGLKRQGKIECLGRGPGALWRKRESG